MNQLKRQKPVKPVIVEGLELYVSAAQGCGMSQSGLARFVGIPESSIRSLLAAIQSKTITSDILLNLPSPNLYLDIQGAQNAKVISSQTCAAICQYYAYDSATPSDIAKVSLAKFAAMGIDQWIKTLAGTPATQLSPDVAELVQQTIRLQEGLLREKNITIELQQSLLNTKQFLQTATRESPGLLRLMEKMQEEPPALPPMKNGKPKLYSVREWLEYKGVEINPTLLRQFQLKLGQTFAALKDRKPVKIYRTSGKGNSIHPYVYGVEDFPYIEAVFHQVFSEFQSDRN